MHHAMTWNCLLMAGLLVVSAGCSNSLPNEEVTTEQVMIEPDDYPDGTDLTSINPLVTLSTTEDDNVPIPLFFVSATDDGMDLAPTDQRVFGHANIPYFNNNRRLRMDFTTPVRSVSILFGGGTFFETEIGRLQVFDASDSLLDEYVTAPRESGTAELMHISRPAGDIAWALAYVAANEGTFGRLDRLGFTPVGP